MTAVVAATAVVAVAAVAATECLPLRYPTSEIVAVGNRRHGGGGRHWVLFRLFPNQLGDPPRGVPILDVQIALPVETQAVGGGEDAFLEVPGGHSELRSLALVRVIAQQCRA